MKKLEKLKEARALFLDYVKNSTGKVNNAVKPSWFWKRVHDRSKQKAGEVFIPEDQLDNLGQWASQSRNMGLPAGFGKAALNKKAHLDWFNKSIKRVKTSGMPMAFLNRLKENDFLLKDYKYSSDEFNNSHSGYFILNAGTTFIIDSYIKKYLGNRDLKIAEIGSGLGGVSDMLMQINKVCNYTYIDLAPTALLGMLNILYSNDEDFEFIDENSKQTSKLNWCIPENLDNIKLKYDVIVNVCSLQEMSVANVHTYIDWIKDHLAEDGIFISINHHTRVGVQEFSEYRFHEFEILDLKSHFRVGGYAPYECVMKLTKEPIEYDLELLNRETLNLVKKKNLEETNIAIKKEIDK